MRNITLIILGLIIALSGCSKATPFVEYELLSSGSEKIDEKIKKEIYEIGSLRGYKVFQKENETYIYIGLGEKNSGGYDIELTDALAKNNTLIIKVKESKPESGEGVTMAFTYPSLVIKTTEPFKTIKVKNENGWKLKQID